MGIDGAQCVARTHRGRARAKQGTALTDPAGNRLRQFVDAQMVIKAIPTLADLSRRSGVSYDTIQKILGGRPPKRQTLTKIADALGVTYIDLFNAREGIEAGAGGDTTVQSVPADYLTRIDALVEQLALDRKLIRDLVVELRLARAEAAGYADVMEELGTQDHEAPADGPADEPPADAHPTSSRPGR